MHTSDDTAGCVTWAAVKPREKFLEFPFRLAVSIAELLTLTAAAAVAVKPMLLAPDPIVTEGGRVTAGLPLLSKTLVAPVAVPLRLTVHEAVPGGVRLAGVQVRFESTAGPPAAFRVRVKFTETPFRMAVSRAEALVLTADGALTVNPALLAPAETVTDGGTLAYTLPLVSVTLVVLVTAPLRFTVQDDVAGGVRLPGEQVRRDTDTVFTCWLIVIVVPVPVALMAVPLPSDAETPVRETIDEVLVVPAEI